MKKRRSIPKPEPKYWGRSLLAMLVSVLLHAAVLGGLWRLARDWQIPERQSRVEPIRIQFRPAESAPPARAQSSDSAVPPAPAQPKPEARRPQQIVDLKQREAEPVQPTELLAAHNARAEKETIARAVGKTQNQAANAEPLPDTALPSEARTGEGGQGGEPVDLTPAGRGRPAGAQSARRTAAPGAARSLVPQMSDLLAGDYSAQDNYIRRDEGPVTLLNARSSPFAGYLIDSGHAVVRYLNINGSLMSWYFEDVQNLKLPLEARMRIARSGEITHSRLEHSSGSPKVDQWFLDALRSGFTGKQPPKDIFRDGSDEFVVVGMFHLDHISVGIP